ncbi:GntR family transcriptional regulator [Simiduia sp. 21SJ11W-1]|uniref:GntR family transcriptional regulator n=1 Tax=Simiduia sp. 21SJ11W-1 TaxID=2909669 RepID=UPI0020A1D3BB|nr:GntR family transcriptional regulator [Simiduia sp. 21SJ11W-1]UTA46983.1 GntR family transcriptional regulator [Simiduia sp. 21SJ11W-1]
MSEPTPEFKTQQERVYFQLREAILCGRFVPGRAVTIRGIAEMLDVSPMPVREALRRLTAENALALQDNRRVTVPLMTAGRLEQIVEARIALETQAALRAMSHISAADLARLKALDDEVTRAIEVQDAESYIRTNLEFHLSLYRYGPNDVIMPLIESLWLQSAPFMRLVLNRIGLGYLTDRHVQATDAIANRDALALKLAIASDIREGIGALGQEELEAAIAEGEAT